MNNLKKKERKIMRKSNVVLSVFIALLLSVTMMSSMGNQAEAAIMTYSASSGNLSASAVFTLTGPTLTILLTNTSPTPVASDADVLTNLLFNTAGLSINASSSAVLPVGSKVYQNGLATNADNLVVGGEWAFNASGIGSSGRNVFGNSDPRFPGANLSGPPNVDGAQYGIDSAGTLPSSGNPGLRGQPMIWRSVLFTLTSDGSFMLPESVIFQYGTSPSNPSFGTPEPSSLLLFGAGLAAVGLLRRRFKK